MWARPTFSPVLGAALASSAIIALLGYILSTNPARADLLIVAPHPDDDLITSAGVILRAREAGETVWVLFMTNGDVMGMASGLQRQAEAVDALELLDVPEENVIFLGYPDGSLEDLRGPFADATAARPAGSIDHQTTTFGERGLGGAEYHRYVFGAAANNNGTNLRTDLAHVLSSYHPAHIFVTSEHDQHPDHRTSYRFVVDALTAARNASPSYNPTIHKTIVWNDFSNQQAWPAPANPSAYFTEPPNLTPRTGLSWAERESLDVPPRMQVPTLTENLKWRAIDHHATQGGNGGYIGQFVHKDEFFWTERAVTSNRPPVPNAGSDVSAGRGATVRLDATASVDPDGDTLSYHWREAGEESVTLSDERAARPSFTVPYDAPDGATLVFELRVSDGTSTSIADAVTVRVHGTTMPVPDAGSPVPDAGNPVPDAGNPIPDAGNTVPDAGNTVPDAGNTVPDAGNTVPDAGNTVPDAGNTVPDASSDAAADPPEGALDTGVSEDAGPHPDPTETDPDADDEPEPEDDAGSAASEDASDGSDAGLGATRDASARTDAGARRTNDDSGCSAALGSPVRGTAWPLLFVLGWLGARRRRGAAQYGS